LTTYERKNSTLDLQFFQDVIAKESISHIVVGLPIHMSGDESQKSIEVRTFGDWLGKQTNLPVTYWDERCTSVAAEELLWDAGLTHKKRKAKRDRLAAQIMLQSYLDSRAATELIAPPGDESGS